MNSTALMRIIQIVILVLLLVFLMNSFVYTQRIAIDTAFINETTLKYYDDFEGEPPGEFPKKWLPVKGLVQIERSKVETHETLLQFKNRSAIRPNFKEDSYLGERFKVEMGIYFYGIGNEQYTLILKNGSNSKDNQKIRISTFGIKLNSDKIVRFSLGTIKGWHRVQLSFNNGTLKVYASDEQLINQPLAGSKVFHSLELHSLNGSSKSRFGELSYFAIAEDAIPLYDRLMAEGKLVVQDINFKVNSYLIEIESYPILDMIAKMLSEHPDLKLSIEGHTDSDGSDSSNQKLSEQRAKSVKSYLVEKSIDAFRLGYRGFGETNPLAIGNTLEDKAKNRRVEFVIVE